MRFWRKVWRRSKNAGRGNGWLTQTHKPGFVLGGPDRTKMFRVKHFGTIGAKNLTRPQTAGRLAICKINRFFGAIGINRRRRLDGLAGLREVVPDVQFADRIEVVRSRQSSSRAMTARKDGKSRCTVSHTKRAATSS